jgi:hypothetical protein
MQTLDLMTLDLDSYNFEPRNLSLSSLLLALCLNFDYLTIDNMNDATIFKDDSPFASMMSNFIVSICNIPNPQILHPTLKYAALFYTQAPLQEKLPSIL